MYKALVSCAPVVALRPAGPPASSLHSVYHCIEFIIAFCVMSDNTH